MDTKAMKTSYRHAAFISYSHDRDPSKSGSFKKLQRYLKAYPSHKALPVSRNNYMAAELQAHLTSCCKKNGKPLDIYRDYTHSGSDLGRIFKEVDSSKKLLVVCSRAAMEKSLTMWSQRKLSWVDLEVMRFLYGDTLVPDDPENFEAYLIDRIFGMEGDPTEHLYGIFDTEKTCPGRKMTDIVPIMLDGAMPQDEDYHDSCGGYYAPIVMQALLNRESNINCADYTNTEVGMRGSLCLCESAVTGKEKSVCIENYNKTRRKHRIFTAAAVCIAVLALIAAGLYAFLFERTLYYSNYTIENGVAEGVGLISIVEPDDSQGSYYALTKRGNETVRLEHVDPLSEIGETDGVGLIEYTHNAKDGLLTTTYYDYNGTKLGVEHRSASRDGTATVNVYADRVNGLPLTYCPEAGAFMASGLSVDAVRSETSSYKVEYDSEGRDARHIFSQPAGGVYGFSYKYSENGLMSEKRVIVDSNGKLSSGEWFNYNDENMLTETGYISEDGISLEALERRSYTAGQLTGIYENTAAEGVSIEYDASGRITRRIMLGDSPVPIFSYRYSGDTVTEYQYMADGRQSAYTDGFCITETKVAKAKDGGRTETITYMDEHGAAVINTAKGYAVAVRVFDSEGRTVSDEYRDAQGAPVCITGGGASKPYSKVSFDYVSELQRVVRFYDADGNELVEQTYTFDKESGNLRRVMLSASATAGNVSYWGYEYSFKDGARVHTWLDENGNACDGYDDFIAGETIVTKDDAGRVIRELFTGENGAYAYSPKHGCWGYIYAYDENGREKRRTCIDGDGRPMDNDVLGYCYYLYSYTDYGWDTRKAYYNVDGEVVISADGTAGYVKEYFFDPDFSNYRFTMTYIDTSSNPCVGPDGWATIEYIVQNGVYVEEHYLNVDGQPMYVFSQSCAGRRNINDVGENGEIIDGFMYLGTDHKPIVVSSYGAAGKITITGQPDENGCFTEEVIYLGTDGKPMINPNEGFAKYWALLGPITDPETGETSILAKKCDYMDPEGGLILSDYGWAGYERTEDGTVYYDVNREPIDDSEKKYRSDIDYDDQGRILKLVYKDAYTGKNVIHNEKGYCGFEQVFEDGWMRGYYLGVDEKPMVMEDMNGLAGWIQEYNEEGILISHIPLDTNGDPIMRYEGDFAYSAIRGICDENGRWMERYYYDLDDQPISVGGAYGVKYDRDDDGNVIGYGHIDLNGEYVDAYDEPDGACYAYWKKETVQLEDGGSEVTTSYHLADGSLCFGPKNYAERVDRYDSNGRHTGMLYYAPDGKLFPVSPDTDHMPVYENGSYSLRSADGKSIVISNAGWECSFDENGKKISLKYIATNGKPFYKNCEGYASWEAVYEDDKATLIKYFDDDGNLSMVESKDYAMYTAEYDGDVSLFTYYDEQGDPFISDKRGYAMRREYTHGSKDITMYLDEDGFPMIVEKYGYAGYSVVYGKENGLDTKTTIYLGVDGQPMAIADGYAGVIDYTDGYGKFVRSMYLGTDGEILVMPEGFSGYTGEIDETLDEWIWCICLDKSGQPYVFDGRRAGWRKEFYDNGLLKSNTSLGVDGLPIEKDGYATYVKEYDEQGRETSISFYAADGSPAYNTLTGSHRIKYEYDAESGNKCRWTHYDTDGSAMVSPVFGYHGYMYTFNEHGKKAALSFFDVNNSLCTSYAGFAQAEYSYIDGLLTDIRYKDVDGDPALDHDLGVAWMHYNYDANGEHVSTDCMDENGNRVRITYSDPIEEEDDANVSVNIAVPRFNKD